MRRHHHRLHDHLDLAVNRQVGYTDQSEYDRIDLKEDESWKN